MTYREMAAIVVEGRVWQGRWLYEEANMVALRAWFAIEPNGHHRSMKSVSCLLGKPFPGVLGSAHSMGDGEHEVAMSEGWALMVDTDLDVYEIQCDDDSELIADDEAALRLVVQRASYGSYAHLVALSQHGT